MWVGGRQDPSEMIGGCHGMPHGMGVGGWLGFRGPLPPKPGGTKIRSQGDRQPNLIGQC